MHNYFRPLEVYEDAARPKRAFIVSEFGGLSFRVPGHSSLATSYGYGSFPDLASFGDAVRGALARADALEQQGLAGFVYTQLGRGGGDERAAVLRPPRSKLAGGA
ncbi:MAG: hypothetical protein ACLSVD_07790 [Eggerthellaceae bacterium]